MNVNKDIKEGLNQAIEYEKGNLPAGTVTLGIAPVEVFGAQEIREIRRSTGFTQKRFAMYLGVSVKTVEAWESGRSKPQGAACRMLAITKADPLFPLKSGIVSA